MELQKRRRERGKEKKKENKIWLIYLKVVSKNSGQQMGLNRKWFAQIIGQVLNGALQI